MSYDIASSFSLNKEKMEMKGSFASNNVYPRYYEKYTFNAQGRYKDLECVQKGFLTEDDVFAIRILSDLVGGSIQLASSTSVKYRYALRKLKESLHKGECEFWAMSRLTYSREYSYYEGFGKEVVNKFENDTEYEKALKVLKNYSDEFFATLNSKPQRGQYIVKLKSGGFLVKRNPTSYRYSHYQTNAKKFSTDWEAEMISQDLDGTVVQI